MPSHDFEIVQVAHSGRCGICVGKLCKAEAFRTAGILVVDESEAKDLAHAAEGLDDLFLGQS